MFSRLQEKSEIIAVERMRSNVLRRLETLQVCQGEKRVCNPMNDKNTLESILHSSA